MSIKVKLGLDGTLSPGERNKAVESEILAALREEVEAAFKKPERSGGTGNERTLKEDEPNYCKVEFTKSCGPPP